MDIKEIKKALEECPTPWRLRSHPYKKYELDCGGNLGVLIIDTDCVATTIAELKAILDMIEMAPVYISVLLKEISSLSGEVVYLKSEKTKLKDWIAEKISNLASDLKVL